MEKPLAENKKASFNYQILTTLEAGIELLGHEVKSILKGQASLVGAYATIKGGELWLTNAQVPAYQKNNTPSDYTPLRSRRLLVKKSDLAELIGKMSSERLTMVPLKMYNNGPRIKVLIGLVRGKREYEKREVLKKRAVKREIQRTLRS